MMEVLRLTIVAEGVGFEPTVAHHHDGFQDRSDKPLRHPSVGVCAVEFTSTLYVLVKFAVNYQPC